MKDKIAENNNKPIRCTFDETFKLMAVFREPQAECIALVRVRVEYGETVPSVTIAKNSDGINGHLTFNDLSIIMFMWRQYNDKTHGFCKHCGAIGDSNIGPGNICKGCDEPFNVKAV